MKRALLLVIAVALGGAVWLTLRARDPRPAPPAGETTAPRAGSAKPASADPAPTAAPVRTAPTAAPAREANVAKAASPPSTEPANRVWLRLLDGDTDDPLKATEVRVAGASLTTDAEGVLAMPDSRRIELVSEGFAPLTIRPRRARAPDGSPWPIAMRRTAAITGVVSRGNGVGVESVRVSVSAGHPFGGPGAPAVLPARQSMKTDAFGRFSFSGLPAGLPFSLRASPARSPRIKHPERITLVPGETRAVQITIVTTSAIVGRVTDRKGGPVARAALVVRSVYGRSRPAFTDADGQYRIEGVRAGHVTVVLRGKGIAEVRRNLEITEEATDTRVDFQTARGLWILGVVKDEAGKPLPTARVEGLGLATDHSVVAVADTAGTFALGPLLPGVYELTVHRKMLKFGEDPAAPNAFVAAGAKDLVLQFQRTGTVSGRVSDNRGRPVDYEVTFYRRGTGDIREVWSNKEGRYTAELRAGTWDVVARIPAQSFGVVPGIVVEPGRTRRGLDITLAPAEFPSFKHIQKSLPDLRAYRARLMRGDAIYWADLRLRERFTVPPGQYRLILERTDGSNEIIQRPIHVKRR